MTYGFQLKDIKKHLPMLIVLAVFVFAVWYFLIRKDSSKKSRLNFVGSNPDSNSNKTINNTNTSSNSEIQCKNCKWRWKVKDGGDDLFICHNCNYDNTKFYAANKPEEANYNNKVNPKKLPNYYNMTLKIDTEGRKKVFPFTLVKVTDGPIELPNRRSLVDKNTKYKYVDIMPGDKIKIVALINLSYTVDHFAFNDDFLVTDKDYIIAYSQAVKEFELA